MKLGPNELCEKLESLIENAEKIREKSLEFLESYKDRVDELHKAAVVHSISSNFQIVVAVLSDGNMIGAVTLTDPFVRSPSPYRTSLDYGSLKNDVKRLFGWDVGSIKSGIFEFPPRVKFLAVVGPDTWMRKEIFQEKIKGSSNVTFAEKVDSEIIRKIDEIRNGSLEEISAVIDDDGIHIGFIAPDYVRDSEISLLSEMAKLVKEALGMPTSRYSKISRKGRVITTATIPLDELWKDDPMLKAKELVRRTISGFKAFVREAGLN